MTNNRSNEYLEDNLGECEFCGDDVWFLKDSYVTSGYTGAIWHLVCHEMMSRKPGGIRTKNIITSMKEEV